MVAPLPPPEDTTVVRKRRRALADALDGTAALFVSGGFRPMNYPGNPYPYRADSHFLYFASASLPDASLLVTPDGEAELFLEPHEADHALWEGPTPDWKTIAGALGLRSVRPLAELDEAVKAAGGTGSVGTLPSADPVTRLAQGRRFGRGWAESARPDGELEGPDAAVADAVIALRLVHDDGAMRKLRVAAEATTAAHLAGMAATKPGLTEFAVRAAMEGAMLAKGCAPAYGSIVTVHGEVLHNNDHHHTIGDGDLLLADVGAAHEGWAGDVTRTWPVSGKFSATQRTFYDIVLQSQLDAIAMVTPGTRYRDIHLAAARTLTRGLVDEGVLSGDVDGLVERGAHALLFPHGVGHIIGLDVHDMEDLGDRAGYAAGRQRSAQFGLGYLRLDRDLAPGMMVTIEPGLYRVPAILESEELAGPFVKDGTLDLNALGKFADVRGIRIEDDVLCTDGAPEVMTAAIPKTAEDVESAVAG